MLSYREDVSKLSSSVAQSQGRDLTCIAADKSTTEHHQDTTLWFNKSCLCDFPSACTNHLVIETSGLYARGGIPVRLSDHGGAKAFQLPMTTVTALENSKESGITSLSCYGRSQFK